MSKQSLIQAGGNNNLVKVSTKPKVHAVMKFKNREGLSQMLGLISELPESEKKRPFSELVTVLNAAQNRREALSMS